MRKPLAFAGGILATLAVALVSAVRMRARYASFAIAFLVVLAAAVAVAAALRSAAGPQLPGAAAPAPTPTAAAAAAATPAPTPTATATPAVTATSGTATPTPAVTVTPTPAATPAPARYNRLDSTGAVTADGSWAFLDADGGVLTTWEGLRDSVATLRIHRNDASGASQATAWGEVETGDFIEWRKSGDCWVRYRVTAAPVRPAAGSSRWEFPAKWSAYAATGAGCTGAVGASTSFKADGDAPSAVRPSDIAAPVRHGPFLLHPPDWTGALEAPIPLPGAAAGDTAPLYTTDLAVARRIPLWRDPALPAGWWFNDAETGTDGSPANGYRATYANERGYFGVVILVYRLDAWPYPRRATDNPNGGVREARTIDGRWAVVEYAPPGRPQLLETEVRVFDEATGIMYVVRGLDRNMLGSNLEPVIGIARSLYRAPAK